MKFSTKATYGLKAMLSLAQHYGENALPISHISKEEGISAAYLEQILNVLKKKGWVKSIRGPRGGYVLVLRPADIHVGDIFEALGEGIRISDACPPQTNATKAHQAAEFFWNQLSQGVFKSLKATSLQDLMLSSKGNSRFSSKLSFSI